MTYIPFDPRFYPIFIYYIILSIIGTIATFQMIIKWHQRKVPAPLYLSLVFGFLTMAIIILTIGMGEAIISAFFKEIYRFSLPFAYSIVVLADIFLYLFVIDITQKNKKRIIPFSLIGIIVIILLFLPWNWWGTPSQDYIGQPDIRIFSTIVFVLYSYLIYLSIVLISYKIRRKSDDKIARMGITLLLYSMISLIVFFLMMIVDTLMIALFDHPGYSIFVYIGWAFAILFIVLSYLSLIMPKWLINLISK